MRSFLMAMNRSIEMSQMIGLALIAVLCVGAGVPQAAPAHETPAPVLRIIGAIDKPAEWSAQQVREQFAKDIQTVAYTSRGQKVESRCVSLLTLLKAAGAEAELKMGAGMEPGKKNHAIRLAVVVVSRDGYTATFSMAELLPEVGGRQVWVALDADGKAFAEGEGHMRLISPEDKNLSRWVRDVGTVKVVDASK
jgi:hypothetical protein